MSFYLLGVFLSDGNIERIWGNVSGLYRVGLSSADEDWMIMIRDLISPGRPIWKRKDQNVYRMEIANQQIAQWLLAFGCHERKSLDLVFPERVPDEHLADCIRGVFDGDGSLTISSYRKTKKGKTYTYPKVNTYICSGSREFLITLQQRLNAAGFFPSFFQVRSRKNQVRRADGTMRTIREGIAWRLQLADRSAIPFLNWMYYPSHPLSMPRKAALASRAVSVFSNKKMSDDDRLAPSI